MAAIPARPRPSESLTFVSCAVGSSISLSGLFSDICACTTRSTALRLRSTQPLTASLKDGVGHVTAHAAPLNGEGAKHTTAARFSNMGWTNHGLPTVSRTAYTSVAGEKLSL